MISGSGRVEIMNENAKFRKNTCTLRVETIPKEHLALTENQVLVQVNKDKVRDVLKIPRNVPHSPFLVLVNKGEPFQRVKNRMKAAMENPAAFDSFTFTLKSSMKTGNSVARQM
jgi:hypothetical protein